MGGCKPGSGPGFHLFLVPLGIVNLEGECLVYISKSSWWARGPEWKEGEPSSSGER